MRILIVDLSEGKDDDDYLISRKNYKRVLLVVKHFFNRLNAVPTEILKSINKIEIFVGSQELAVNLFSFIMQDAAPIICNLKYFSRIHHLFQHDNYSIESMTGENYESTEDSDHELIFLSDFLTINGLYLLSMLKNVFGFRKVVNGKKPLYEKLLDSEKYLTIGMALYYNVPQNTDKTNYPIEDVLSNEVAQFAFAYKTRGINKFRFRYHYPQNHFELFISVLQDLFGTMLILRCKNDSYSLPSKKDNLLIINVERLSEAKRAVLYSEILSKKFSDQLVVIVDTDPEDLIGYPKIVQSTLIPSNFLSEYQGYKLYEKKIEPVLLDIEKTIKNFQYIINQLKVDKTTKSKLIKELEEKRSVTNLINLSKIDFWYNLELVQTEHLADIFEWSKKNITDRLSSSDYKDNIFYILRRDRQKDLWIILKNDEVVKKISYSRSKGIKYIAYLVKYYHKKTVSDTKLRTVVDKWHGKTKKTAETSTDAKKILQDLIYLFEKQCPELSPLRDCIIISSKDPGCYFEYKSNITVEIEDDSIPKPV